MHIETKLPKVGTTIFTVMSQLAMQHKAVNLGQGFPDFDGPELLREALTRATHEARNQYAPMTGIAPLREQIAKKTLALYGRSVNMDSEITVTSGATEALFCAIAAIVRPGESVVVIDPCYDSYEPAIELNGGCAVHVPLSAGNAFTIRTLSRLTRTIRFSRSTIYRGSSDHWFGSFLMPEALSTVTW